LKIYGTQEEIPYLAGLTADYAQVGGPEFTAQKIFQMGLNGTFFDAQQAEQPTTTPASFALRDPKGKDAQFFLTEYTIKTALDSSFQSGEDLDITGLLSQYLNVTVTTDEVGTVIPEILTKYGSGKPVGISAKWVSAAPAAQFVPGAMAFSGSVRVTATVDGEVAVQAAFDNADGKFGLHSDSGKIFGKVTEASAGTVEADFKTTLGITAAQLQKEVQDQIDSGVAELNIELADGVEIPTIMGIDVSDVQVDFFTGYMELGASLSPKSWTQIAAAMSAWKQRLLAKRNAVPVSHWYLKDFVDRKTDELGDLMEDSSDELNQMLAKASDKFEAFIGKKKDAPKEDLRAVTVDIDGKHWDLGRFLDRRAKKLTDFINKKADQLEDLVNTEVDKVPE